MNAVSVAVVVLGGAVVSLGIAWIGAATSEYSTTPNVTSGGFAGSYRDSVTRWALLSEHVISFPRDLPTLSGPSWWRKVDWSEGRGGSELSEILYEEAHGFPLRCFLVRIDPSKKSVYRWGITLGAPTATPSRFAVRCEPPDFAVGLRNRGLGPRRLPLMPIPLGLTIDTLFWGACLALAARGMRSGKRANRRRLGLCEFCKYPRPTGSAACPECGKA